MSKYLLIDFSNILHRCFYAQKQENEDTIAGMAAHVALTTLNKYAKMYKGYKIVAVFDRSSWRKEYTASDLCLSRKPYKGNRRQNMTPSQQLKYQHFKAHVNEIEEMITNHTSLITLANNRLEADDLIAGFIQQYANKDTEITCISADSDLLQLTRYPNVVVLSPITDKPQSLADFNNDPLYYLFTKCLRGDSSDNIASAFPRVQQKRILKAYNDPFEQVQLMQETWTNENGVEFVVKDLFEENQLLIDLEKQPDSIRRLITETLCREVDKPRQFSLFHIMKFIGKYKLDKIKQSIDQYIPMLSR